ncbi:disulfide bond formation protein B [Sphingomonas sp.]|uniref:disulfide bond formation protein B n=1 Tax=Sphingomonas sp. TaxID=28214 RepID=UPI002DD666C7|nr:disulfide bond formation protein B [Sphingomonas sp.]
MPPRPLIAANRLALLVPAALMAGALGSQYWGGLYPCEMCQWQRWPHYAAIVLAGAAFLTPPALRRALVILAAFAIATSGAIGVFHAGVEYGWWPGITGCTSTVQPTGTVEERLAQIMAAPMVRCDVAPWSLAGISLAGWNAIVSLFGVAAVLRLAVKK